MEVNNSLYIFQQDINTFFKLFEFISAYIDELLISTKGDWRGCVHKLELTLTKRKENGLKCNIESYLFRQTNIEYLCFLVTRDGLYPIVEK